jgi:hypothetical protein
LLLGKTAPIQELDRGIGRLRPLRLF